MSETKHPGGPVRLKIVHDGEAPRIVAKNDFCTLAWGPTDGPDMVNKVGFYGPSQVIVELLARPHFDELCRRAETEAKEAKDGKV